MDLLPTRRPKVLVSDIGMPDEDGYVLIKRVRGLSSEEGGDLPAIALTGYVGGVNQYAQRIISTPGTQDGLAWQTLMGPGMVQSTRM